MPWSKNYLTYSILKLSYVILTISFTGLCGILFIVFFAPLVLDLADFMLKMDYQGPAGNPGPGIPNSVPNLYTIVAKVQWRWNNNYRSLGVFSTVPVGNFNSNFISQ